MIPRSYGSNDDEASKWLLFVRDTNGEKLVFTAVVTQKEKNVVAELQVDADALKEHSEELGLEMEVKEFKMLLVKALEQRPCVALEIETEDNGEVKKVFLSLTYKFSPTISRKGFFQLPIVASDAPPSLAKLLSSSIHDTPPQPMLSQQQKKQKLEEKMSLSAVAKETLSSGDQKTSTISSGLEIKGVATVSQSTDNGTTTAVVNPMLLKRRYVPTGTMRRKDPRGAKLAKK